jgi:hypothetical protein
MTKSTQGVTPLFTPPRAQVLLSRCLSFISSFEDPPFVMFGLDTVIFRWSESENGHLKNSGSYAKEKLNNFRCTMAFST